MGIPFDVDLIISPVPHLNDTSTVKFKIATNSFFIHNIQFEWTYTPTIKLENLAESWGARPRVGDFYEGGFDFVPERHGMSMIDFNIFGKNIYAKLTGKSGLNIPFYMIFDTTGTLLYLGESNIYECKFRENDPLREQLEPAFDFPKKLPRPSRVRSKPDFEQIEKDKAAGIDTLLIDSTGVDSLPRLENNQSGDKH